MNRLIFVLLAAGCHHSNFEGSLKSDPDSMAISRAEHAVANSTCLSYSVAGHEADVTVVEIREKHDSACGGDPATAPIAQRLRVHESGAIEHYDVTTDRWK